MLLAVAAPQVFRNCVHPGQPEERHEQEGGDQHREAAANEIEVHHHGAVAVGIRSHADHVLGSNVGHDQRHRDRPPGQRFAGQEEVLG